MLDFKEVIAKKISEALATDIIEIKKYVEVPKGKDNGDYAFPCFSLAKEMKKSPMMIANELQTKISCCELIEKVDVAGGYLNFTVNKKELAKTVLEKIANSDKYGKSDIGTGKNIVIDYSAPNIAKPFHIGHLRSTVIGASLYNVYTHLGYNVTGVNHLGDYGTQFGKLIEGYKMWGDEYKIDENPIDELTKIYIRINNLCKEDEKVLENCRNNFRLLEEKDEYCVELWDRFRKLSLQEFKRVYDLLRN